MERCPVCRARFKDEPVCYRCGADLSRLLTIEAEAAEWQREAIIRLGAGQWLEAYQAAQHALALQFSPLAAAARDFARRELLASESRWLERLLQ